MVPGVPVEGQHMFDPPFDNSKKMDHWRRDRLNRFDQDHIYVDSIL